MFLRSQPRRCAPSRQLGFKILNKNKNSNPNGSLDNIAGIFNTKKNILGMMPHPERMVDEMISNTDGVNLFSSLINK